MGEICLNSTMCLITGTVQGLLKAGGVALFQKTDLSKRHLV